MSLLDHIQPVRPTGEECCRSSSNGAPETQTPQIERKSGQIPCCIRQNETQQPSQATSRIFVVLGSELTSSVWVHHPQHVPVQKLVFGDDGSQLCFHELSVSQRSPQHFHSMSSTGSVWSPLHTIAVGSKRRAASVSRWQPGGSNPPLFQTCVFPKWTSMRE